MALVDFSQQIFHNKFLMNHQAQLVNNITKTFSEFNLNVIFILSFHDNFFNTLLKRFLKYLYGKFTKLKYFYLFTIISFLVLSLFPLFLLAPFSRSFSLSFFQFPHLYPFSFSTISLLFRFCSTFPRGTGCYPSPTYERV